MSLAAQDIESQLHFSHREDSTGYKSHLYRIFSYLTVAPEHGSEDIRKALLGGIMPAAEFVRLTGDLQEGVSV